MQQLRQGLGEQAGILLVYLQQVADGVVAALLLPGQTGQDQAGPHTGRIGLQRLLEPAACRLQVIAPQPLLGQFAVVVGGGDPAGRIALGQALADVYRPPPLALLFVQAQQATQRLRRDGRVAVDQVLQQRFGARQHTGGEKVVGQLELGPLLLQAPELGTGQQVLVDLGGLRQFAALAELAADAEVRLEGFVVDFQHIDQTLQGRVGLVVEQVVVTDGQRTAALQSGHALAATQPPAATDGGHEQTEPQQLGHGYWPLAASC
ncbi:hypothetical protein D3C78_1123170 [compost metagenome]